MNLWSPKYDVKKKIMHDFLNMLVLAQLAFQHLKLTNFLLLNHQVQHYELFPNLPNKHTPPNVDHHKNACLSRLR